MKKYKIIWFDDEYESLYLLKEQATINGIDHIGFTNAEEGLIHLINNYRDYDAVIIDGLFYRKTGQSGDVKTDSALVDVFRMLDQIKEKKLIPSFILSGQSSYTKLINPFAEQYKDNKVYDKLNKNDLASLWADVKEEADKLDDTQIRHQFIDFFSACADLQLESGYQYFITDILKSLKFRYGIDEMLYYAQLRKVLEIIFRKAEKIGLLHSQCIQGGKVNLSESSLFLSGEKTKHLGVYNHVKHFPKIISQYVKDIIFNTGAAVHTEDDEAINSKLSLDDLRRTNNNSYHLYSLTFQLMDVLIWYKNYADENPDVNKNKSLWQSDAPIIKEGEWIKGEVIRIAENGFGTFQPSNAGRTLSIIPAKVIELSLRINQLIEVTTKYDTSGTKKLIENIRLL